MYTKSLVRIEALKRLGVSPLLNHIEISKTISNRQRSKKRLARWCNHKSIFNSIDFKNYKG